MNMRGERGREGQSESRTIGRGAWMLCVYQENIKTTVDERLGLYPLVLSLEDCFTLHASQQFFFHGQRKKVDERIIN